MCHWDSILGIFDILYILTLCVQMWSGSSVGSLGWGLKVPFMAHLGYLIKSYVHFLQLTTWLPCSNPLCNTSLVLFMLLELHLHGLPTVQSSWWPLKITICPFIIGVPFHSKRQLIIANVLKVSVFGMDKLLNNTLKIL